MKKTIMTLSLICISFAEAGVTLKLQHPRYPSQVIDSYLVKCEKDCAIEIVSDDSRKGLSSSVELQTKIKELLNLHVQGFLPKRPAKLKKILYNVSASDGVKQFDLTVGYPMSYSGTEYTKYAQLISVIEDLKFSMRSEIQEKK